MATKVFLDGHSERVAVEVGWTGKNGTAVHTHNNETDVMAKNCTVESDEKTKRSEMDNRSTLVLENDATRSG